MKNTIIEENQSIPWVEKYRPSTLDNIVLDPLNKIMFQNIIQYGYFPNLLFYGPPGGGKTSTIINLIQEYQKQYSNVHIINKGNIIHLNASDERGIDIIRNQISQFVSTKNMFDNGLKFVILDEVDYMTKNAQQALKILLQTAPSTNIRYCLICNYISKIDESIQHEFITVRFNQLPEKDILHFIRIICQKENIHIDDSTIRTIRRMFCSDIRSMINYLQSNHHLLENSKEMDDDWATKLHNLREPEDIKRFICNVQQMHQMDFRQILLQYSHFLIRNTKITSDILSKMEVLIHTNNGENLPQSVMIQYFIDNIVIQ